MKIKVTKGKAIGTVLAPPSKSDAHRALIAAALGKGSAVYRIGESNDVRATLDSLTALGATVQTLSDGVSIGGIQVQNVGRVTLPCGESGTTARLLLPLCLGSNSVKLLQGKGRLPKRPMDVYQELCRSNGLYFESRSDGFAVGGTLTGGTYTVRADKSSQFLSGLLYYLPLCKTDSILRIDGELQSRRYVDMTLDTLRRCGITVYHTADGFAIPGGQKFRPNDYTVEGDWSGAAFLSALNFLGGAVTVTGLRQDSLQADRVFDTAARNVIQGKSVDLSDCPDLAPILFAVAAATGGGRFTGTERLRYKESDRIAAMQSELAKFGVRLINDGDLVTVSADTLQTPSQLLDGHGDHRIVMSIAVLCTLTGGCITDAEAVSKSYPAFWNDLKGLGIKIDASDQR